MTRIFSHYLAIFIAILALTKAENNYAQLFESGGVIGGNNFNSTNQMYYIGTQLGGFIISKSYKQLFCKIELNYSEQLLNTSQVSGNFIEMPFLLGYSLKNNIKQSKKNLYIFAGPAMRLQINNKHNSEITNRQSNTSLYALKLGLGNDFTKHIAVEILYSPSLKFIGKRNTIDYNLFYNTLSILMAYKL